MIQNTEKLRKLAELVKRGIGGEAKNAEDILKRLLEKEGMTLDEFLAEDEELREYEFRTYDKWDKTLLFQIYSMVTDTHTITYWHRRRTKVFSFELTKSQYIELKYLYSLYMKALSKEFDRETEAFFIKNNIYPQSPEDQDTDRELTEKELEELMKIYDKVGGTSFIPVRKAIENK